MFMCRLFRPMLSFFFFNDTATTEIYTLSLHDALPISEHDHVGIAADDPDGVLEGLALGCRRKLASVVGAYGATAQAQQDRKSTRLNSSHSQISYAVFCLKKKKTPYNNQPIATSLKYAM